MMTVSIAFRIALHLLTGARRLHQWRIAAVLIACCGAVLLVLAAASVYLLLEREQARIDARWPILEGPNQPGGLSLRTTGDSWNDEHIVVHWIEPVPGVEPVLPPGLDRMLEPGEAAVSPKLDRLARSHPELAARYPRRVLIGFEGLQNPDELIAYYRPADGRTLGDAPFVMRIAAFGDGPPERRGPSLAEEDPPNGRPILLVLAALMGVPALVLMIAGLAAVSDARRQRFQLLHWVGAPPSMLAMIGLFEVLILAAPCAALLGLAWYWVTPRLESIPLLDRAVVPGDLQPPLWVCLGASLAVALAAACMGAWSGAAVRFEPSSASRPGFRAASLSPIRLGLLCAPWLTFTVAEFLRLSEQLTATLSGLILLTPAAVFAVPYAVRLTGRLMLSAKPVALFIAACRSPGIPSGAVGPSLERPRSQPSSSAPPATTESANGKHGTGERRTPRRPRPKAP